MSRLWWIGTVALIVVTWFGMEQLTWVQELRPGVDILVRISVSTVIFAVAAALNPFEGSGAADEAPTT